MLGDEIRYLTAAFDRSGAGSACLRRYPDQAASREIIEGLVGVDPTEAGNPLSAPGDDDLVSGLHPLQIFAEAVVQLANPNFVS